MNIKMKAKENKNLKTKSRFKKPISIKKSAYI